MENKQKAIKKKDANMFIFPPMSINIDSSSILSISYHLNRLVLITQDCIAKVYGNNKEGNLSTSLPKDFLPELTQFDIKDEHGVLWYPNSAFCSTLFTLYMVSTTKKEIGDFNPVLIFGGGLNCAALDKDGRILYIPGDIYKTKSKLIEPQTLPNSSEKAISIVCGTHGVYVLSSSGKVYDSSASLSRKLYLKFVKELKSIKIVQIAGFDIYYLALSDDGRAYSCCNSIIYDKDDRKYNEHSDLNYVCKFTEISTLKKYKINYIYSTSDHSFFQTSNGQLLCCKNIGKDYYMNYKVSLSSLLTVIKSGVCFCVPDDQRIIAFHKKEPEMCPNKVLRDEIMVVVLGSKEKSRISQIFFNNNFDDFDTNKIENDEYHMDLEINNNKIIHFKLIDSSSSDEDKEKRFMYYHRAPNLLFFFDVNDASTLDKFKIMYDEVCSCCSDFKCAVVAYGGVFSSNKQTEKISNSKYLKEIMQKSYYKVFNIDSNDMAIINKPFYHFIQSNNNIVKIGKQHRNPFLNIDLNRINIALFGDIKVNKTDLAFRLVYDEFYGHFYNDFKSNYKDIDLFKIIEINSKMQNIGIIDSSYVTDIKKNYYSLVQGIIFVFSCEIVEKQDYIETINIVIKEAKESVKNELIFVIGLKQEKNIESEKFRNEKFEKINEIEKEFNCNVFVFSTKTGENVNEMLYFLTKKIIKISKQTKRSKKKKKHIQKK